MKNKILTFIACAGAAFPVYAGNVEGQSAEVEMPIRVQIIQCGTQEEAIIRCITDEPSCCPLVTPSAGEGGQPDELLPDDEGNYE